MSYEYSNALCWSCQNACGGCSWSDKLIPVEGWKAKVFPKDTKLLGKGTGYEVVECPLYIKDKEERCTTR